MMILNPKIRLAIKIAAKRHEGQMRKDGVTPFIIHPIEVALIVAKYSENEDIICTALLHDTIEDTGYTVEEIRQNFGDEVAAMVDSLTDRPLPDLEWNEKHRFYLEELKKASDGAILVCLADKWTTVSTRENKAERKWYYKEVAKIAKERELIKKTELLLEFEELVS